MITLNEIAYNIKNLAYGGVTSTENNISLRQIKHWIHYHRAKLIADNIDKGITNNQALYQSMNFTLRNSTSNIAKDFYDTWDAYDIDPVTVSYPIVSGAFLSNHPKNATGDRLNGEWLALSSLSADTTGDEQAYYDADSRSFYGDEISSSQLRGDFRNFGSHSFWIPRPLQLKNDQGIKDVRVSRYVYSSDDPLTTQSNEQQSSYGGKEIKLYRKEQDNFDEYNKFTDHSKPYYIQSTTNLNRDDGYSAENFISLRRLQVSPNYHGGLKTPGNKKVFWKYRASSAMILENPTEIDMMWSWSWEPKTDWDDATTPYPIPLEWVSDLIQRVLQIEIQVELKTTPDIITDGLDDNVKQKSSGAQVQK